MSKKQAAVGYDEYLAVFAVKQKTAISRYHLSNGQTVWVRKAGAHNAAWKYALLGMITKPLRLGVLKPVPSLGGEAAIEIEACRLKTLAAAGVNVPKLLAQQKNALMMGDLGGVQLDTQVEKEARRGHITTWKLGLNAIADVHQKGQFLSQAFARNMMFSKGIIGFLDFEDDPSGVLSVAECQSRDWLCYLHSTSYTLKKYGLLKEAADFWAAELAEQPQEIQELVRKTAKPIRWMHRFHHSRWGRDTLRVAAIASLFYLADLYL